MALEEGLDTGPVYACVEHPIGPEDTLDELRSALSAEGTELLLRLLAEGLPEPTAQVGEPTYAAKIEPGEHHLDWAQPAEHLHRVVRLGQAWTTFRGRRLLVPRAALAAVGGGGLARGRDRPVDPRGRHRRGRGAGPGRGAARGQGRCRRRPPWRNGARLAAGDRLGT